MHVDSATIKRGNKSYTRHLLRTSYREDGKVKKKTLLNLSGCSDDEINAIKLALKHKKNLTSLASLEDVKTVLGKRIGAVWALNAVAERIGLSKALGSDLDAKTALLQVIARVVDQGSRLSAVRFAKRHAVCEILGIKKLNEGDLYSNLAWLAEHQERIEKQLFERRFPGAVPTLFLDKLLPGGLVQRVCELGLQPRQEKRKEADRHRPTHRTRRAASGCSCLRGQHRRHQDCRRADSYFGASLWRKRRHTGR